MSRMSVVGGAAVCHHRIMSIRGKDAQETRFRRYIWWQANRDWLGSILTLAGLGAFFLLLIRFLG